MFSLLISRARALVPTFVARPTIPRREMSQMQRKLHRKTSHRLAMLRNMVTSLIKHERIKTTVAKAKNLKPYAEKLIKWGKRGTHHDKVMAAGIIREQLALRKLFEVLGPRYMVRNGGYTRVLKLAKPRRGDGAPVAIIEFVDRDGEIRMPRPPRPLMQKAQAVTDTP